MSKIQNQVIFHVKKSSQNFSLDHGLNRLSFFRFRRYNLRDNFLRLCFHTRKRARKQLGFLLQRRFKNMRHLGIMLKSYSAFFLTYISKHFRNTSSKLYDVNTFSYVYFLNRLFSHLNRFLMHFLFFNYKGFANLNVLFNILHLLYPGVVYKNLIYRLWYQAISYITSVGNYNTFNRLNYFILSGWKHSVLSKKYVSSGLCVSIQKKFEQYSVISCSNSNVNEFSSVNFDFFKNKSSFKKISTVSLL